MKLSNAIAATSLSLLTLAVSGFGGQPVFAQTGSKMSHDKMGHTSTVVPGVGFVLASFSTNAGTAATGSSCCNSGLPCCEAGLACCEGN